jgi:hypothetical protein
VKIRLATKETKLDAREDKKVQERRDFIKNMASLSLAAAFGGLALKAVADKPKPKPGGARLAERMEIAERRTLDVRLSKEVPGILGRGRHEFKVERSEVGPGGADKPEDELAQGDLAKLQDTWNKHPDMAVHALLKQVAYNLAVDASSRQSFQSNLHNSLRRMNILMPKELLPRGRLQVPAAINQAAAKRKGWGIGGGHSNHNRWSRHNNHRNYSDYTDWW